MTQMRVEINEIEKWKRIEKIKGQNLVLYKD